jgi:hypothetical protein
MYNHSYCFDYFSDDFEELLERVSIETGSSPELDDYEYLIENPINLKTASVAEFLRIPGFSSSEARKVIDYCRSDSINTLSELRKNINLTDDQVTILSYFSTFDKTVSKQNKKISLKIRNKNYINKPESINNGIFKGDELDLYQRLSVEYENFALGLLTDKDFGERKINDFQSGYLSGNFEGYKVILGDYYVESGSGNLLWKNFGRKKGADVINSMNQNANSIKEYRSSINYKFFRGVAAEKFFSINNNIDVILKGWYSNIDRDGNYDSLSNTIKSIYKQGYFRTESEIAKISAFNEKAMGSDIMIKYGDFAFGSTILNLDYNHGINTNSKADFMGKSGNLISIYGMYHFNNLSFSSELSQDANSNIAFKFSSLYESGDWSLTLNYRSFLADFRSPFGYNFGESSTPSNEWGIYTGIRYSGIKNILFSGYFDYFGTFAKSYYVSIPYTGFDLFLQSDFKLSNSTKALLRFNYEKKPYDDYIQEADTNFLNRNKTKLRFDITKSINKKLELKFRLDAIYISHDDRTENEKGFGFLSEIKYEIYNWLKIGGRYSLFETDGYKSAIWQYELASSGYMTTTALYGSGYRAFVFADLRFLEKIKMRIRYSIHEKNNIENFGSGYLKIKGNNDSRLLLQLDLNI